MNLQLPLNSLNNAQYHLLRIMLITALFIGIVSDVRSGGKDSPGLINEDIPVALCESYRRASITSDGYAVISASAFDDGSTPSGSVYFKVRRETIGGCNNINGDDNPATPGYQEYFDDYVKFCCEDIGAPVITKLRVYDVDPGQGPIAPGAFAGHWNECWSEVTVEDKLPPTITCPADMTVSCNNNILLSDLENNNLNNPYGYAIGYDNCNVNIIVRASEPQDCGVDNRFFTRTFTATDPDGRTARCTQRISLSEDLFTFCDTESRCAPIQNLSTVCSTGGHTNQDNAEWPCDLVLAECSSDLSPNQLVSSLPTERDVNGNLIGLNAYPRYDNVGAIDGEILGQYPYSCGQIATEYSDQVFTLVADACLKILRTWTVIDWCQFDAVTRDPDDPNRFLGHWQYIQIIKIMNTAGPTFLDPVTTDFCDESTPDCLVDVSLSASAMDDCTPDDQLHYRWTVDYFSDASIDLSGSGSIFNQRVPQSHPNGLSHPGTAHTIRWTVEDGCQNKTVTEYTFTAVECKKPTPYCADGTAIVIMPSTGCISFWAADLDAGSSDNCTDIDDLIFTIRVAGSNDPLLPSIDLCCEDIENGVSQIFDIEFCVTDEANNTDCCITHVDIQDTPDNEMPEGICEDHLCDIYGHTVSDILCHDNGTPTVPQDDTYSFTVHVDGESTAGSWIANDPNATTGIYQDAVLFGPYLISNGSLNFTITDIEEEDCFTEVSVMVPPTCSDLCILDNVISDVLCHDNSTPTDPSDDTYTFTVIVNEINVAGSWSANDPNQTTGAYNTPITFGPYPIADGVLNFTIEAQEGDCETSVSVSPPETCSDLCIINNVVSNVVCHDNDTPTIPNDDTYMFTVIVSEINVGGAWVSNDPNNTSGEYNTPVNFGPYLISDGNTNFTIEALEGDCNTDISVQAPMTCSDACLLDHVITNVICSDNGTPSNPDDDNFTFDVQVSSVNVGGSWVANDPNNTTGIYNTPVTFGPYPISGGGESFIINAVNGDCNTQVAIDAPSTCSDEDLCSTIYGITRNSELYAIYTSTGETELIKDAGFNVVNTLSIHDELGLAYFASESTVYWIDIESEDMGEVGSLTIPGILTNSGGAFSQDHLYLGVEDIQDLNILDIYRVKLSLDGKSFVGIAQNITMGLIPLGNNLGDLVVEREILGAESILISVRNSSTSTNDLTRVDLQSNTFEVLFNLRGDRSSQITKDSNGTFWLFENSTNSVSSIDVTTGIISNTVITDNFFVDIGRTYCGECALEELVTNITCTDNDSPANPDDDLFFFDVVVSGSQTGSTWTANDPNNTSGSFNEVVTFGPYSISEGSQSFIITGDQVASCQITIIVDPPSPCSDEMLCTTIYGLTTNSELFGINTETGAITFISSAMMSNTNALAINDELGLAYFASGLTIFWTDISTAEVGEVGTISIPGSLSNGAGAYSQGYLYVGPEVEIQAGEEVSDIYRLELSANGKSFVSGPDNITNNIIPNNRNFGDFVMGNTGFNTETIIISSLDNDTRVNNISLFDVGAQSYTVLSSFPGPSTAQITRDNQGTYWLFENSSNTLSNLNINTGQTSNSVDVGFGFADLGRAWCDDNMNLNAQFSGNLMTQYDEPVAGHQIQVLSQDDQVAQLGRTTGDGSYGFRSVHSNHDIRPYKNDDTPNGLSTLDLIIIQRHVLGIETFTNPYTMIAADADGSKNVNILDILELQQIILGLRTTFANNTSWRYPAQDIPMEINNPFDFDDRYLVGNCSNEDPCKKDYVAIKIGDVNGTASLRSKINSNEIKNRSVLNFNIIEDRIKVNNNLIKVPITSSNFEDISGFQYTLSYDLQALEFINIESGTLEIGQHNINSKEKSKGYISTNWYDINPQSFSSEEVLFTLTFKGTDISSLGINSHLISAESYQNGETHAIQLNHTKRNKSFYLYQNRPNPFSDETLIAFDSPSRSMATLKILDINGQLLWADTIEVQPGRNNYYVNSSKLNNASGLLYFQINTNGVNYIKKMIILK